MVKKIKAGDTLLSYVKELSIVILGILIAFWLNEVGVSIRERAEEKRLVKGIYSEVELNIKRIDNKVDNTKELLATFTGIRDKTEGHLQINYYETGLSRAAYETAHYTGGLSSLERETLIQLVDYYSTMESLEELDQMVEQDMFNVIRKGFDTDRELAYTILLLENLDDGLQDLKEEQEKLYEVLKKECE